MSNVLKLSGPLKVGGLAADPANPEAGFIYFNTTTGSFRLYENGAFRVVSAEELAKLGTLNASPTNYTPTGATYAGHLEGIDSALGSVSSDASGTTYTPSVLTDWDGDADPGNVDGALDQLAERVDDNEIAIAAKAESSTVSEIDQNVDDLITLSGVAENATDLGTFTGDTIPDASSQKSALQALETLSEANETAVASKANQDLGNLTSPTAINQNLLPDVSGSRSIGASGNVWNEIHVNDLIAGTGGNIVLETSTRILKDGNGNDALGFGDISELLAYNDLNMNSNKITGLLTPTASSDGATKGYVDAVAEGLKPKTAVKAASTANGALATDFEDGDTLDGVTLATGNRILLKDQTDASENGIYVVNASGAPTRATDFDSLSPIDEINGAMVAVQEGTENSGIVFVQTGTVTTIDSDDINFIFFNSSSSLVGGDGITVSGSNVSIDHDGQGLDFSANQLSLEIDGGTLSKGASGVKVADGGIGDTQIAAGIDAAKLADGSVSNTELQYINSLSSNAQDQIDTKMSDLVDDTTPQLGGNLDTNGNAILGDVKRGNTATPTNLVEEEYIDEIALSASQTDTVIAALTFAHATFEGLEMVYKIKESTSGDVRIGTIRVVTNGTDVVLNDIATETNDTGVTFSAVVNGSNINIRYSSGANGATMRADVKRFRA